MTPELTLDRLAIHHIDANEKEPEYAPGEHDVANLEEDIKAFFLEKAKEV